MSKYLNIKTKDCRLVRKETEVNEMALRMAVRSEIFFFPEEEGLRDVTLTGVPDVCAAGLCPFFLVFFFFFFRFYFFVFSVLR